MGFIFSWVHDLKNLFFEKNLHKYGIRRKYITFKFFFIICSFKTVFFLSCNNSFETPYFSRFFCYFKQALIFRDVFRCFRMLNFDMKNTSNSPQPKSISYLRLQPNRRTQINIASLCSFNVLQKKILYEFWSLKN